MLNPNQSHDKVDSYVKKEPEEQIKSFPKFFTGIKFDSFRHIKNIELNFIHPITVIAGSNKSGKTTVLLSIACSHYNFKRRNVVTGDFCRNTWGIVSRFVSGDVQDEDWIYYVSYREGKKSEIEKKGQRRKDTKKWSGVAKKEGQIGTPRGNKTDGRCAYLIDLERIIPARHLSDSAYKKVRKTKKQPLNKQVEEYFSYIFETNYTVAKIGSSADCDLYSFASKNKYSSYNSASGEDALTRILQDIVAAPNGSLILIEEIEIGLHPKIQRKLMDVLFYEASNNQKQFIVTTHSATILSSVKPESRIFIDTQNGVHTVIPKISINAALTKMDADDYPIADIYVEDDLSKKIVDLALKEISKTILGFSKLINVVVIGSADKTFNFFSIRKQIYSKEKINRGFACILDGDMRDKYKKDKDDDLLFFHFSKESPESMLVTEYLNNNNNDQLSYHLKNSENHCLFKKMVDLDLASSEDDAFNCCWQTLLQNPDGQQYFQELQDFIKKVYDHFANDL